MDIVWVSVEAQCWDMCHGRVGLWDLRMAVSAVSMIYANLLNVKSFLIDNVLL